MKCDELKQYEVFVTNPYNTGGSFREIAVLPSDKVDEAIAELKAANKLLKEHIANGDVSRITWIDEVIELKQKLHDAEMRADLAEAAETERKIDYNKLKEERRWRKFSEEKPQWGVDVLMLSNEGEILKARFSFDYKWISWGVMKTCESDCITHWMPLPEQPKESDKWAN